MESTTTSPARITIVPSDLLDNDLNIVELITLAGLHNRNFEQFGDIDSLPSLEQKGFITRSKLQVKIAPKGVLLMRNLIEINSKIKFNNPIKRLTTLIDEDTVITDEVVSNYRSLFKGTKPGAMGGEKSVKTKLIRFLKEHPRANVDVIMEATRRYLNALDSYRYVQQADYFIYKRDNNTMDESSRLSAFVDEVLSNPNDVGDDWTTNIV